MKLDDFITPSPKINLKWIEDFIAKTETIKVLQEKMGSKLFDFSLSNGISYICFFRQGQQKQK